MKKSKTIILGVLVVLGLALIIVVLNYLYANYYISKFYSFNTVQKVTSSDLDIESGYKIVTPEGEFIWVYYPIPFSLFPTSGPPAGIFNSRGYLVDFTPDSGDDPEFQQKWESFRGGEIVKLKNYPVNLE